MHPELNFTTIVPADSKRTFFLSLTQLNRPIGNCKMKNFFSPSGKMSLNKFNQVSLSTVRLKLSDKNII